MEKPVEDLEQGGGGGGEEDPKQNIFQVKVEQETRDVDSIEPAKGYLEQDRGSSLTSEGDTASTVSGGEVNLAFVPETSPRGHSRKPSSVLSDISLTKVSWPVNGQPVQFLDVDKVHHLLKFQFSICCNNFAISN